VTIYTAEELEVSLKLEVDKAKKISNARDRKPALSLSNFENVEKYHSSSFHRKSETDLRELGDMNMFDINSNVQAIKGEQLTFEDVNITKGSMKDVSQDVCLGDSKRNLTFSKDRTKKSRKIDENTIRQNKECEQCGAGFTQDVSLKRHIRAKHSKIREFSCNECEYATYRKDKLAQHTARHNKN
jgi:hypothetical protein